MLVDDSFHRLTVTEVVQETAEASSFILTAPPDLRAAFRYEAGQFLTLKADIGGRAHLRSYSLSSAPAMDEPLKITVKRVRDGIVSNWLIDSVRPGDRLLARPPAGRFLLQPNDDPLVMFAGGSGITPVLSLIKSALVTTRRPVSLLYANRDRGSIIFGAELEALQRRWPGRLEIVHHLDETAGCVRADEIASFIGQGTIADCYVCGPAPLMDLVERVLADQGIPANRTHIEKFVSLRDPTAPQVSAASAPPAGADAPETISILLSGQAHDIPYTPGKTILTAALGCKLPVPWSCTEGHCGACLAQVTEGRAVMDKNDVLSEEEVDEGFILICQARPIGSRCSVRMEG